MTNRALASKAAASPQSATGSPPSDTVRTIVSLLLFIHLFSLTVIFFANRDGSELVPGLASAIKDRLRVYLYPLWMDRPYHYHLTHGDLMDYDHYVEVELKPGDQGEPAIVRFPDQELPLGHRRERYKRLSWHLARLVEAPQGSDVIPLAVGGGSMRQYNATKSQVRLFRTPPYMFDEMHNPANPEPVRRPAEQLYVADVFFLPGFAQPQLNKIGERRDVAPVTGAAPSTSSSTPGSTTPTGASRDATGAPRGVPPANPPGQSDTKDKPPTRRTPLIPPL